MRVICVACCCAFASAPAQTRATPADLDARPVRGWLSVGLGGGSAGGNGVIGPDVELNLSRGWVLVAGRAAFMTPTTQLTASVPDDRRATSSALLIGARTSRPVAFATAAIGFGTTRRSGFLRQCAGCAPSALSTPGAGLALEGGVHTSARMVGLSANLFGLVGARNASLTTVSLSADVGWFGR